LLNGEEHVGIMMSGVMTEVMKDVHAWAVGLTVWLGPQTEWHTIHFAAICTFIHFVVYYLHGWLFVLADWYGFLDKYSIRQGKQKVPSLTQQWEAIYAGSIDTFIVKPILFFATYPLVYIFLSFDVEIPSTQSCFLQWLGLNVVFSTSLYFLHGAMHYFPWLYKNVHKRHHTYHETVGFAAQFAHPVEGLFSALHTIFGVLLIRPHVVPYLIYLTTQLIEIIDSHCGYDVPWSLLYPWSDRYPWGSGSRAHDYHHSHNRGMYGGGMFGLWDRFMRTDSDFRAFERKRVDQTLE